MNILLHEVVTNIVISITTTGSPNDNNISLFLCTTTFK